MYYSNEDFENFYVCYKAEGLSQKICMKEFCMRNKVPLNLFDKWYHDTHHRIKLRSKIDAMKADGHPPRSELLDKAVSYLDSFWAQIMAYRNDGRYSIDNNIAERFMKPLANERKNSMFYGSDRMAHTSTIYHTLISTCIQMKASVSEYFGKLFAKIVRGCTYAASMLPMNIGLTVKPC
ncbi:MAG: transposase [Muribaculum sp.]|nr:transposase [Muribaculum sp.]